MAVTHRHRRRAARATVRYLHTSRRTRSARCSTLVRGLPVDDAIRVLQLCEKDAADDVLEAARLGDRQRRAQPAAARPTSCSSRASGPTRARPASRAGRVPAVVTSAIRKRTSHVTIVLARYDARRARSASPPRGVERPRRGGRAAPSLRARAPFARSASRGRSTTTITITTTKSRPTIEPTRSKPDDRAGHAKPSRRRRGRPRPTSPTTDADEAGEE